MSHVRRGADNGGPLRAAIPLGICELSQYSLQGRVDRLVAWLLEQQLKLQRISPTPTV
jgi:hypothetical protein